MAYEKNKYYIEINDSDNYHKKTVEDGLSDHHYYYYWECDDYRYHHKDYCTCEKCAPEIWATFEDEQSYRKSTKREERFRELFKENTMGDLFPNLGEIQFTHFNNFTTIGF